MVSVYICLQQNHNKSFILTLSDTKLFSPCSFIKEHLLVTDIEQEGKKGKRERKLGFFLGDKEGFGLQRPGDLHPTLHITMQRLNL